MKLYVLFWILAFILRAKSDICGIRGSKLLKKDDIQSIKPSEKTVLKWDRNGPPFQWSGQIYNPTTHHFLEIELLDVLNITEIRTGNKTTVKTFVLLYGTNLKERKAVTLTKDNNKNDVHVLNPPLLAKYIMLLPIVYSDRVNMELEIKACIINKCPRLSSTSCLQDCNQQYCNGTFCVNLENCPCDEEDFKNEKVIGGCSYWQCRNRRLVHIEKVECSATCNKGEEIKVLQSCPNCSTCVCADENLKCTNRQRCLHPQQLCDGVNDCTDGHDESCCPVIIPSRESDGNTKLCSFLRGECGRRRRCQVRDTTIINFNENAFDCHTCDGFLMIDRIYRKFSVAFTRRYWEDDYVKTLQVKLDDVLIGLTTDFAVHLQDGNKPTRNVYVTPSDPLMGSNLGFIIHRTEDTIYILSTKYGFLVRWKKFNHVDIEVDRCLEDRLEGLCGPLNNPPITGDFRSKFGSCIKYENDFCLEWSSFNIGCTSESKLNQSVVEKTNEICLATSEDVYVACGIESSYFLEKKFNSIIGICAKSIHRDCTPSLNDTICKCEALKYFFSEQVCDENTQTELFLHYNCTLCPPGMKWSSCGYESTCAFLKEVVVVKIKGPGCYCTNNLYRKGDECVPSSECYK